MRPLLHYTAPGGWLNDPNGLIFRNGRHHLYYQYDPDGNLALRFDNMYWGHASSTDLLRWRDHPVALAPGVRRSEPSGAALDSPYDADGCYSGVLVQDGDRTLAVYTGRRGDRTLPCLATALDDGLDDGLSRFVKYEGNPVIAAPPSERVTDFRDHSVGRLPSGTWRQIVGGGIDGRGTAFVYTSPDLLDWTYRGTYLDTATVGIPGRAWECPDLFHLDGGAVLVVSAIEDPIETVWWATGTDEGIALRSARCGLLDVGDRFYAPQSYLAGDGRRLMFGWIRLHLDHTRDEREPGRGASADPGAAADAAAEQWSGAISLPRELALRDGELRQRPARELREARHGALAVSDLAPDVVRLTPSAPTRAVEVELSVSTTPAAVEFVDERSGRRQLVELDGLPSAPADELIQLFFDTGIVEIFAGTGTLATSVLAMPELTEVRLHLSVGARRPHRVAGWVLRLPGADPVAGPDRCGVDTR